LSCYNLSMFYVSLQYILYGRDVNRLYGNHSPTLIQSPWIFLNCSPKNWSIRKLCLVRTMWDFVKHNRVYFIIETWWFHLKHRELLLDVLIVFLNQHKINRHLKELRLYCAIFFYPVQFLSWDFCCYQYVFCIKTTEGIYKILKVHLINPVEI
jgi:hypothetical protein